MNAMPKLLIIPGAHHGATLDLKTFIDYKSEHWQLAIACSRASHTEAAEMAEECDIPAVFYQDWDNIAYESIRLSWKPNLTIFLDWHRDCQVSAECHGTISVHSGPVYHPFNRPGLCGSFLQELVLEHYRSGKLKKTGICVYFGSNIDNHKTHFFHHEVPLYDSDTPEIITDRLWQIKREYLPMIATMAMTDKIVWTGLETAAPAWFVEKHAPEPNSIVQNDLKPHQQELAVA